MTSKWSKYKFTWTWLFLLSFNFLLAQSETSYRFTNLSLEDGLADNWCLDALMDSYGFMWFATHDGLSSFDGQQFRNFRHQEDDSTSIGGNVIMELMETEGGLWIASNGGGLNFYDRKTEEFTSYFFKETDSTTISANTVVSLFEDEDGLIWVGTFDRGFNRFNPKTGKFKRFSLTNEFENLKEAYQLNSVLDIVADNHQPELLWIAANNGLYSFDKRKEQLEYWSSPLINKENLSCHKIQHGGDNNLWVAVVGAGMCQFNTQTKEWMIYPSEQHWWERGNKYGNYILDMERKSPIEWWVAHRTRGLGVFNEISKQYTFTKNDPINPFSIVSEKGFGICKDRYNRLWYLSFKEGISFLDPSYQVFNYKPLDSDLCVKEASNIITAFARDKYGKTYITTKGCDGLFVYDKNLQILDWAPRKGSVRRQHYYSDIFIDSKERIWILNDSDWDDTSLLQYDAESGYCIPFQHPVLKDIPLHDFALVDILEDEQQNIWLASEFQGLIKIDHERDTIIQYVATDTHPNYISPTVQMSAIKLDSKGRIWIATASDGVFLFHPETITFQKYGEDFGDKKGLPDRKILSLEEDFWGRIWVGTNTRGIQLIDLNRDTLISFQRENGLPSEQIGNIRKDSSENIWVATNKGLCKYNKNEKSFISFGKKEGLSDPDLIGKGLEVGSDGTVFLGQHWGFYYFHPDSLFINKAPPPVYLSFFKVFGKDKKFDKNINFMESIHLNYDENFFTIGFTCLNYSIPNKSQYAYILEGFDKEWVYPLDQQALATYTNVDPGAYTFKVIAANNDGVWNDFGHSLDIVIGPPYWEQNWFYALCATAILSLLYLFYRWRLNAIKTKARTETQLAELELKALRSQMNPHFIFNSLNSIKLLIQAERKMEASDYLTKFSKMIRNVLHHSDRKIISLTEELEIAKLFLSMEELRFQHKFEYAIEVYDDLDPDMINVPPLIFQPYLENAIWHGLMHLEKDGKVSLSIRKHNGLIQCVIDDNGIGREMAQQINRRRRSRHKSVGISITQERLRLSRKLNNSQMGVSIVDKKNEEGKALGTTIIINLN